LTAAELVLAEARMEKAGLLDHKTKGADSAAGAFETH
jgi:hypothetical protein